MRNILLFFGACLLCSCILVDGLRDAPLEANLVAPADTVFDVYGEIRVVTSLALDSEQAEVLWDPPVMDFRTELTPSRDTLVITLTEELQYDTRYRLILVDNSRLREGEPLRDTLFLRTTQGEMEWNNTPSTADTLRLERPLSGNISSRSDADWFWLLPDLAHDSALVVLDRLFADVDLTWLDSASLSTLGSSANLGAMADTVRVSLANKPALLRIGAKPNTGTGSRYRLSALPY